MKAITQSKKLLCLGLLTVLMGGIVLSGCGKAEEEADEAKNEVKKPTKSSRCRRSFGQRRLNFARWKPPSPTGRS